MAGIRSSFRICPRCQRAVPLRSKERFCINDGETLLEACPSCQSHITNPHALFCPVCGFRYASTLEPDSETKHQKFSPTYAEALDDSFSPKPKFKKGTP